MHGVFGEFALLLLMSAAVGGIALWPKLPVQTIYSMIGSVTKPGLAKSLGDSAAVGDPRAARGGSS